MKDVRPRGCERLAFDLAPPPCVRIEGSNGPCILRMWMHEGLEQNRIEQNSVVVTPAVCPTQVFNVMIEAESVSATCCSIHLYPEMLYHPIRRVLSSLRTCSQ